jgi:septation ring formation regulator EzrA
VLILHIISWRRLWERVASSHFASLPEKLKAVDPSNFSLMEAGDNSAQPLSASERQLQALTANIQELARQSAADRREMQELAKQNQELMALLRSRGEIPSPGQGQNGGEIPRNETGRNQNQSQN